MGSCFVRVAIAQAVQALLKRVDGLRDEVRAIKYDKELRYSFFALVDIVELRSHLVVCGECSSAVWEEGEEEEKEEDEEEGLDQGQRQCQNQKSWIAAPPSLAFLPLSCLPALQDQRRPRWQRPLLVARCRTGCWTWAAA